MKIKFNPDTGLYTIELASGQILTLTITELLSLQKLINLTLQNN